MPDTIANNTFPPRADHEHEWESHLQILASVLKGRSADYVSTPLTSGRRYFEWFATEGYKLEFEQLAFLQSRREQVERPNTERARWFVETLRAKGLTVIDPTVTHLPHWTQNDYRHLWGKIIQQFVRRVWFLNDWEYSNGCCFEFFEAIRHGIETVDEAGEVITSDMGATLITVAINSLKAPIQNAKFLRTVHANLTQLSSPSKTMHVKDELLDALGQSTNIAQFVSYGPGASPPQRFCRIIGIPRNFVFESMEKAIETLLANSADGAVNVRSFKPDDPESHPFTMGMSVVHEVVDRVRSLSARGLWTIVNEMIDVKDGGVSGVLANDVIEFSPDATPRCVESPGTARMPSTKGASLLETVYGFRPALNYEQDWRVEFSIHPLGRGARKEHTIIWEIRNQADIHSSKTVENLFGGWPNNFSRFLGDKVYGLLVADSLGLYVPRTTVISRRCAPFTFGQTTNSGEFWLRTAPSNKAAGFYTTQRGWTDPFNLMQHEDPSGEMLPTIVSQEGVRADWSGALVSCAGEPQIEGVQGFGDKFMQGEIPPTDLPRNVIDLVRRVFEKAYAELGPVSMEWAMDGTTVWILQLHKEQTESAGDIIVPGEVKNWTHFDIKEGLESLRRLVESIKGDRGVGIQLVGRVGITSHFADVLRRANIPAKVTES